MNAVVTETEEVYRYGTGDRCTHFQARCLVGGGADWRQLPSLKGRTSRDLSARLLGRTLEAMDVVRCYLTKNGGCGKTVDRDFFTDEVVLPGTRTLARNPKDSADAVWLGRKEAFIDLGTDRMFFLAHARNFNLAGRYSSAAAQTIVSSFNTKGIAPREVRVKTFFSAPSADPAKDVARRFKRECRHAGLEEVQSLYKLPVHGHVPYAKHPDPTVLGRPYLAIISIC